MRPSNGLQHTTPLVEVKDLTIDYWQEGVWVNVVNKVTFSIEHGEAFGLAGESGCGKSTSALALLGYLHPSSRLTEGEIYFDGVKPLEIDDVQLQKIRGAQCSYVPQDPSAALSPNMRIGTQVTESILGHKVKTNLQDAEVYMLELLEGVQIPDPEEASNKYPHQFSGGQQQRIIIAMALACGPKLIVLDEPTTALDVTTQSQILDLLIGLQKEHQMAMLYVTHNLGVMASIADRVGVMYAGELVETAPIDVLFSEPRHPYTRGLIDAIPRISVESSNRNVILRGMLQRDKLPPGCRFAPRCDYALDQCLINHQKLDQISLTHNVACWRWKDVQTLILEGNRIPHGKLIEYSTSQPVAHPNLLELRNVDCAYLYTRGESPWTREPITVVKDVSFTLGPGETFALVGESGSGKSTVARTISGLLPPTSGSVYFKDIDITSSVEQREQPTRQGIQIIFQNPAASLNPRQRVRRIIGRPLEVFFKLKGRALREKVISLLDDVNLDPNYANCFPDQLSGGEQQRVAIARALAAEPELILCDEILSALDVSVQANVLDLLRELQRERGLAYLFISHDLAVVRTISDRVGVLYQGELWEVGKVDEVFDPPHHPYTDSLLISVPDADPAWVPKEENRMKVGGIEFSNEEGCPFANRCMMRTGSVCHTASPAWQEVSPTHFVRCHVAFEELHEKQMYIGREETESLLTS